MLLRGILGVSATGHVALQYMFGPRIALQEPYLGSKYTTRTCVNPMGFPWCVVKGVGLGIGVSGPKGPRTQIIGL